MRCPKCTSVEDKVIDSRISKDGSTIRRRRECLECGYRYSTTESVVRDGVVVIKRDGRREDFDREKLVRAVRAACHKRPIDNEQITMLIEDVIDAVEAHRLGLGRHLCQNTTELNRTIAAVLDDVLKLEPQALAVAKRLVLSCATNDDRAVLDDAAEALVGLLRQPAANEGMRAFKEKRSPPWLKPA